MQRTAIATIVTLALLVIVSPLAHANVQDVLGDETHADVTYPPVPWGSGYILPDSPLYKMDDAFQSLRLLLAFSPDKRAMVRSLIMGERAAEARVMNSRGNTTAMNTALDGLVAQANAAASDLNEAAARGKDVTTLAKSINDMVKFHRDVLKDVAAQSDEAESLRLESLNQELLVAKLHIEDNLKADILASEIESDLDDEIDTRVLGVETQAGKLEDRFNRLDRLASRAAEQKLKQENFKAKKAALKDKKQKLLEDLKARQKKLQEERKERLHEAKEAAKKAREAAQKLRDARRAEKESGRSTTTQTSITPSPEVEQEHQETKDTSGSSNTSNSGSSNSGSGSSNSGSGSSGSSH